MGRKNVEESIFYRICFFFFAAEERKDMDLRPIPQDLLLRISLCLHFAGRGVQVRQRQLESHLLHKRGEFPNFHSEGQSVHRPKAEQLKWKKEKHKSAFIRKWDVNGATRFGPLQMNNNLPLKSRTQMWYFWVWTSLTMGLPQQKGIPHLWLTPSQKVFKQLTKKSHIIAVLSKLYSDNAQTFLSFWPNSYFLLSPTRGQCVCVTNVYVSLL